MYPIRLGASIRRFCTSRHLKRKVDYYATLGVNSNADQQSIKTSYFRLAKKYHPDYNKTPTAAPMFEFISEAYEVLSDPIKRQNYDEHGTPGETTGGMSSGPQRKHGDATFSSEDLFRKMSNKAVVDPNELDYDEDAECLMDTYSGSDATRDIILSVSFEDAARGCIYPYRANQKIICPKCDGSKSEMGYQGATCPYCEGTGIETLKVGHVKSHKACSYCFGSGIFIKWKCNECAGLGAVVMGQDT